MILLALLMLSAPVDSLIGYPGPVQHAAVGDHRVAYYETGTGAETVLLVHGLGTNLAVWKDVAPLLAPHYRVIAVDLPGYGLSSKDEVPATMAFFAQTLTALLDTLGIERVHYAGLSMGGQIGLRLALSAPDRIDKMVLLSPAGIEVFTPQESASISALFTPEAILQTSPERYAINVALNFHAFSAARDGWLLEQRRQIEARDDFHAYAVANARSVAGMLGEPVWDEIPGLAVPTLVLYGEDDKLIPNRYLHASQATADIARKAARASPLITAEMLPAAGHILALEVPELVTQRLLAFLKRAR